MARIKIGVMGAQGCGKSALVARIAEDLDGFGGVEVIGELAREIPDKINERMTIEGQRWLFQEQMDRERMTGENSLVVCDRTVVDPVVYALWVAEQRNDINWHSFVDARIVPMLNWFSTYDVVYWCRPSGLMAERKTMLVVDGVRSVDLEFQADIDTLYHRIIGKYKIDCRLACEYRLSGLIPHIKTVKRRGTHGAICVCSDALGDGGDAA